jgi:hypothetical protein
MEEDEYKEIITSQCRTKLQTLCLRKLETRLQTINSENNTYVTNSFSS